MVQLLHWNVTQSIECVGQGLITNSTNHVWISCTTYLARGRLKLDELGDPVGIELNLFNYNALDGPQERYNTGYGHIGDGDYVELASSSSADNEVWFGLEGGSNPRVLPAAIARYHADTLEFIELHVHPTLRTMAFLAYHTQQQVAYVMNWTQNEGKLQVFDAAASSWRHDNASIAGLPTEYKQDVPFMQGADMHDNVLYLMLDDFKCTLFAVDMSIDGILQSVTHLGLGHEREGIDIVQSSKNNEDTALWLLSMDNQWSTWEGNHYAEIVRVQLSSNRSSPAIPSIVMVVVGVLLGTMTASIVYYCLHRLRKGRVAAPSYIEVVQRQPSLEAHAEVT